MLKLETEQTEDGNVTLTVTARGRGPEDLQELDDAYEALMSSTRGQGGYNNSFSFTITTTNND